MATPAWEATWIPLRLMVVALRTIECVPDEPTINSARTAPVIRQQGQRLRGFCLVANIQLGLTGMPWKTEVTRIIHEASSRGAAVEAS